MVEPLIDRSLTVIWWAFYDDPYDKSVVGRDLIF